MTATQDETPVISEKPVTLGDVLDTIKELTKTIAGLAEDQQELSKQIELSRKAGKF